MSWQQLFPSIDREQIQQRIQSLWDLTGRLPVPRFAEYYQCPSCYHVGLHARLWRLFVRRAAEPGRFSHRCDVSLKCAWCGLTSAYGVPLTEQQYFEFVRGLRADGAGGVTIHWREAQRLFMEEE
jgi:hypothetical protein